MCNTFEVCFLIAKINSAAIAFRQPFFVSHGSPILQQTLNHMNHSTFFQRQSVCAKTSARKVLACKLCNPSLYKNCWYTYHSRNRGLSKDEHKQKDDANIKWVEKIQVGVDVRQVQTVDFCLFFFRTDFPSDLPGHSTASWQPPQTVSIATVQYAHLPMSNSTAPFNTGHNDT